MLRSRPSYPERRLRRLRKDFIALNWKPLTAFGLLVAGAAIFQALFASGYLLGFIQGATVAATVSMIGLVFLMQSGAIYPLAGIFGENNTRDILKGARRRNDIFDWLDNLEVVGGDVDHVVVTPAGVLALDSKWHLGPTGSAMLTRDTERAVAAARRARLILRSEGIVADVRPVVVVWGNTSSIAIEGEIDQDVVILTGGQLRSWLRRPEQKLSRDEGDEILSRLKSFKARVDPSRVRATHR